MLHIAARAASVSNVTPSTTMRDCRNPIHQDHGIAFVESSPGKKRIVSRVPASRYYPHSVQYTLRCNLSPGNQRQLQRQDPVTSPCCCGRRMCPKYDSIQGCARNDIPRETACGVRFYVKICTPALGKGVRVQLPEEKQDTYNATSITYILKNTD